MLHLIEQHQFWVAVAAYWLYSAAVSSMPEPTGGNGYKWLYGFCHAIAGNLTTAFGSKIPGMKVLALILLLPLTLALPSCAAIQIHPGAVNTFDSATFDVLVAAKATIDTSRAQYTAGALSPTLVPIIDAIAKAYDVAYPAWTAWRTSLVGSADATTKLANLNAALQALAAAEQVLQKGGQ